MLGKLSKQCITKDCSVSGTYCELEKYDLLRYGIDF